MSPGCLHVVEAAPGAPAKAGPPGYSMAEEGARGRGVGGDSMKSECGRARTVARGASQGRRGRSGQTAQLPDHLRLLLGLKPGFLFLLLLLLVPAFADLEAHRTRMLAAERLGDSRADRILLREVRDHAAPGHRCSASQCPPLITTTARRQAANPAILKGLFITGSASVPNLAQRPAADNRGKAEHRYAGQARTTRRVGDRRSLPRSGCRRGRARFAAPGKELDGARQGGARIGPIGARHNCVPRTERRRGASGIGIPPQPRPEAARQRTRPVARQHGEYCCRCGNCVI